MVVLDCSALISNVKMTWHFWPALEFRWQLGRYHFPTFCPSSLYACFITTLYTMGGADKELYKLELLSLVSRISQELFNHTKLQDKNLAEFVISVGLVLDTLTNSCMNKAKATLQSFPKSSRTLVQTFPMPLSPTWIA